MPTSDRLLQAISYNTPPPGSIIETGLSVQHRTPPLPHLQDDIRKNTMELSKMSFSSPSSSPYTSPGRRSPTNVRRPDFVFPVVDAPVPVDPASSIDEEDEEGEDLMQSQLTFASAVPSRLSPSVSSSSPSVSSEVSFHVSPPHSGTSTPRTMLFKPSGLSLLRQEYESIDGSFSDGARTPTVPHSPRLPISLVQQHQLKSTPLQWTERPELSTSASLSGRTSASITTTVTQRPLTLPDQSQPLSPPHGDRSGHGASTPTSIVSPPSGTPTMNSVHLRPFTSGFESMTHFGSPASLRPPSESTPLLRSGTPRSRYEFGRSSPSPVALDAQKQYQHLDLNELPWYTPSQRSPSPQLELGIEGLPTALKQQGLLYMRLCVLMNGIPDLVGVAVKSMPAVLLGCLLNVLDSVSCGYIYILNILCYKKKRDLTCIFDRWYDCFPCDGRVCWFGTYGCVDVFSYVSPS